MNRKCILIAAASVLFAVPLQAQAIDVDARTVSFADLDLSTAEGRKTLDRRLAQAVDQVCGELSARSSLINRGVRKCRETTLADAHAKRDIAIAQYRTRNPGERDLVLRGR